MVFLEAFACPSLTIPNRRNETIARCCARHTPLLPSSIAPNKRMWNVNEHATRQEGDISRNSHGMALTAGEGNAGGHTADPSRGAPPFIAHNSPMSNGHFRDNQFPLMHHQQQRMDPNAPHGSASYLFPSYMGSDPSGYYNYPGMHHSGAANPPHQPPNMEISRLVNMREEHNIMERDVMNQTILKKKISNEAGSSYAAVAAVEVPANFCKQPEDASFQVNKGNGEVPSKSDPQESEHGTSFGTEEDPRATENESEAPAAIAKAVSSPLTSSGKSRKRSPMEQPRRPKIQDTKWLKTLEELKDYKVQYGDTIVPRGFPENPRLASWVAEQRKQFKLLRDKKQSSITQERIDLLNQLDFAWNAQEAAWSRHMQDLRCFSSEHGHCHVPLNYEKYPKLGLWVKEQRRHYTLMKQKKSSHMTVERCAELTTLGFCYDTHESTWMERWRELAAFKEKTGSCVVPSNHYNTKLATWVHHQRRQYKRYTAGHACHITSDRIRRLDQLEFVWNPRQSTSDAEEESSSEEERAGEISASDDDETDRSEEEESEPSPRRTPKKRSRRV